jgi:hypothetical protein
LELGSAVSFGETAGLRLQKQKQKYANKRIKTPTKNKNAREI